MDPKAGKPIKWNNEASEATPGIFRIPLILNLILEQLPNSKLLELSLVSKLWKKEARSVMKKRGSVMALLKCRGVGGCGKVFQDFAANLETLNEALYSGMTIRLSPDVTCKGTGALELERIHESFLAGMRGKLKRLSIRLDYPEFCWNNTWDCPNFLLLQLLLRDFIGDLEHLTLEIKKITEPFIQEFLPPGPYPKLKVSKLHDIYVTANEETFVNQIRTLLSRAPNLQEIHTYGILFFEENLMEGREGVVHVHESYALDPVQDISQNALSSLRLQRIRIFYITKHRLKLDIFNEKAKNLLRTCCVTTLKSLELEEVSAVLLMSYGIQLVHVEELRIELNYLELEQLEPRLISIMSRLDFTYLFPNLSRVIINNFAVPKLGELSRDTMDAIIEQAKVVPMEPTLHRAGNIKYLVLYQNSFSRSALQFYARMLPVIEKLEIRGRHKDFPFGSAWELWPDLKRINVKGKRYERP